MALMPKRVRWRKHQRRTVRGIATRGNTVAFGEWGIQSLEAAWLTAAQIEAARVAGTRRVGTAGKLFIRVFPHKPITATPAETRMGTGKGEPEYWTAVIRPGTMLFEIGGVSEEIAKLALNRIAHKLPVRTKLVQRRHEL
jgi:large subunit ribosomal protein L16